MTSQILPHTRHPRKKQLMAHQRHQSRLTKGPRTTMAPQKRTMEHPNPHHHTVHQRSLNMFHPSQPSAHPHQSLPHTAHLPSQPVTTHPQSPKHQAHTSHLSRHTNPNPPQFTSQHQRPTTSPQSSSTKELLPQSMSMSSLPAMTMAPLQPKPRAAMLLSLQNGTPQTDPRPAQTQQLKTATL